MTATGSRLPVMLKPLPTPLPTSQVARRQSEEDGRLRQQLEAVQARASEAAQQGDIVTAARLILAGLDCERRLASRGPQVLQLIKPRG
jgi:hypothetical protein